MAEQINPGQGRADQGAQVVLHNVLRSQVVVGDGNVAVQIQSGGGALLENGPDLSALVLRPLPVLRVPEHRHELVGRAELVDRLVADLAKGVSVQIYGEPGVGRSAVAEAVVRRVAAAGWFGAQLLGAAGRPHTLDSLYSRLAGLFLDTAWHRPDEELLRAQTARLRPAGLIVITDCDLDAEETKRLLATFPRCTFLITSRRPTLPEPGTVHEVKPLTLDETRILVRGALGRDLLDPENAQVQRAHELSRGRVATLVTCAAFLRRASGDAKLTARVGLSPQEQISLLATGLSMPARQVLAALASFGATPATLFAALVGPIAADGMRLAAELEYAGLIEPAADGYRVTADTAEVLGNEGWAADPGTAGAGLLAAFAQPGAFGVRDIPPPSLALTIAQTLAAAQVWVLACQLLRAAVPVAIGLGEVTTWSALVGLGVQAAEAAGRPEDLRFFLRQQHTDALIREDRVAAALALAALANLLRATVPVPPASPPPAQPARRGGPARRALSRSRKALVAGHGLGAVAAATVAAAIVAGAAFAVHNANSSSSTPQSGTLASAGPLATVTAAPAQWTLAMQSTPLTALPTSRWTVAAQYPVVSGGIANSALRNQVDQAVQQPVRDLIANLVAANQAWVNGGGTVASGPVATETTTMTQTGDLISLTYTVNSQVQAVLFTDNVKVLILRRDTGSAVPQDEILTAQASTPTGAQRITALLAAQDQANQVAPDMAGTGCADVNGDGYSQPLMAFSAQGLVFYLGGGFQCNGTSATTVPLSRLTGLVDPQLAELATVRS